MHGLTEYYVTLTALDLSKGLLDGEARILYTNTTQEPLVDLLARLYPNTPGYGGTLEVRGVRVNGYSTDPSFELAGTAARIPLPDGLAPGRAVEIAIDYEMRVPPGNRSGYGALNREDGVLTLAGFYPALAVYEAQGWTADLVTGVGDPVYAETACFAVTVTVPSDMVVVTSGRALSEQTTEDGMEVHRFVGGPMRDFALAVGRGYAVTTGVRDDILVRFFHYTDEGHAAAHQVLSHAGDALQIYQRMFGPYPYTELELVEAPISASGLEYPGVVLLGSRALNQGPEWLELVVAHEVAHQWWYGVVGNDQVNAAWLDEGLASYSSLLYFRDVHGADRANAVTSHYYQRPYYAQSASLQQMPANLPVTSYTVENYGPVVYIHATNFFHDLHQALGEEAFVALMQRFLAEHRYGIAEGEDFVALAKIFDAPSVEALYSRWILGRP